MSVGDKAYIRSLLDENERLERERGALLQVLAHSQEINKLLNAYIEKQGLTLPVRMPEDGMSLDDIETNILTPLREHVCPG